MAWRRLFVCMDHPRPTSRSLPPHHRQMEGLAMTPEESQTEWRYRVEERLGILAGAGEPTPEQRALAVREANEALIELDSAND